MADVLPQGNKERAYQHEHSWDQLEEDEHGRLRSVHEGRRQKSRRERLLMNTATSAQIRRGMIRYLELVIDLSQAATIADMRAIRSSVMFKAAERFIRSFFDENPLSQLGIVVMKDGVACQLTDLSSSPETHIEKLRANLDAGGNASVANALDAVTEALRNIPPYGHREAVLLLATLSTCDPGDIMDSIKAAAKARIRVSVIGLAAEVHIFKILAEKTHGKYGVALDEEHMDSLLLDHAVPPPSLPEEAQSKTSLVHVGFPSQAPAAAGAGCFVGFECVMASGAYICPRCKGRMLEVPSECHLCGLTLIASPHLARSYHHLFPVKVFKEIRRLDHSEGITCFACCSRLEVPVEARVEDASEISQCDACAQFFCLDCDEYIHSHIHSCPGCEV